MELRCLALDLDRTTLDTNGRLAPQTRAALCYAMERGVTVIPASGRSFGTLPWEICRLPGIPYAITSNGACVHALPTGAILYRERLNPKCVAEIYRQTRVPGVFIEAFSRGVAYGEARYLRSMEDYGAHAGAIAYTRATRVPVQDMGRFIQENDLEALDVLCWEPEKTEALRQTFSRLPDCYLTGSSPQRLEFSHPQTGKHRGAAWVLEQLGLEPKQLMAFGDGDNDAHLLQFAGLGIAVGNATPACLRAADAVTDPNDCLGVANAIYHFIR